ncbi:hypothetical protein H310_04828 [Aphanomyces invadans]|uniref:PPM-type phosphatase domain-containing protein n=1 Tax=Aphanomyces invadans TaxID=157072 RepID=A0A024UAN9_9STRA|nr:hypothetical protein H310_04828 [Aphanomyces invadans]ETW03334.1 hypothetical protein H310_04828 [Aphanomyces invadans]|eukprot:XP_008867563.1 hypothetical protein H310_04828 [Aphanomyces invadans]
MGNFLSSPKTDKITHVGTGNGISYGVSCMQGWRTTMEDAHVAETTIPAFAGSSLFAVFDGHGGNLVAEESALRLVDTLAKGQGNNQHKNEPDAIGAALRNAFLTLDNDLRKLQRVENGEDQSGCTAIAAIVTDTHIIVANSGDSRSVLATCGDAVEPMSFDHKPNNPREKLRIENAGGMVRNNRVNGDLAVSRALGDYYFKERHDLAPEEQQVSPEPDIKIEARSAANEFLLLACDGVWDVLSNEEACDFVRSVMKLGERDMGLICEELLDHCLSLDSRDNMSVVLVAFDGAKFGEGEGVYGLRKQRQAAEEAKEREAAAVAKQQEAVQGQALRQDKDSQSQLSMFVGTQ